MRVTHNQIIITIIMPQFWKQSFPILIYKKGDIDDPENFRPITLQPVLYKIYAATLCHRLFDFIKYNNYIDKKCQKAFWPGADGVAEHTQTYHGGCEASSKFFNNNSN